MSHPTANALLLLPLNKEQPVANTPTPRAAPTATASLTRRLVAGDGAAFEEFHKNYFNRLYRFLLVVCQGCEHQAQDALQETLARVVRYVRPIEDENVFWSWLKALARSAAHDGHRKQRRYLNLLQKFAIRREGDFRPQSMNSESRLHELLEESLSELKPDDRRLIEGKYIDGETVCDLALGSKLTEKAVESRLSRARRSLRERMLGKLRNL